MDRKEHINSLRKLFETQTMFNYFGEEVLITFMEECWQDYHRTTYAFLLSNGEKIYLTTKIPLVRRGIAKDDLQYDDIARRDWERGIYAECDKEDREALNK